MFLLLWLVSVSFAEPRRTCVASFLGATEAQFVRTSLETLAAEVDADFVYRDGNPYRDVRECLTGYFTHVVFIGHVLHGSRGRARLALFDSTRDGVFVGALDDRIFAALPISPSLRRFTLYACDAEGALRDYGRLTEVLAASGVTVMIPAATVADARGSRRLIAAPPFIAHEMAPERFERTFGLPRP